MIQAIFGLPGMGKTTVLTKIAQKSLSGKRYLGIPPHKIVYTNFECQGCYKLDFKALGVYAFNDALILIDEIMLLADTRDFKTFPPELKRFFALHRHWGIDVVWCSQYWDDCDKKIRVLTDRYYLMTAMGNWTIIKPIQRFLGVVDGKMLDSFEVAPPISWKFIYRPHYYSYFDSFVVPQLPDNPALELWEF